MKVLVACEESQAVTIAFRERGHEAYSCDILDCSGGHPEWHIKGDAIDTLYSQLWDLVIAHPPCTRLANSGVCWIEKRNLWLELELARQFFMQFIRYANQDGIIAIENPIPHKHANLPKYTQIIQPWMFGHPERKATCLWLYGLPELVPTNNVKDEMMALPKNIQQRIHYTSPGPDRARLRSKTFPGIAKAFADQYSRFIESGMTVKEWEASNVDNFVENNTYR